MDCDICGKLLGSKQPFHCATCARSTLYPLRIEQAAALIDRSKVGQHVAAIVESSEENLGQVSLGSALIDKNESAKTVALSRTNADTAEARDRIDMIMEQAEILRQQIEEGRKEMAARKSSLARKSSELMSATHDFDNRRSTAFDKVQSSTDRRQTRTGVLREDTVEARQFLCKEAAQLAQLRKRKIVAKEGGISEEYSIGGLKIFDLRELKDAEPNLLTASLTNAAHLLVRVSHYLAVRLPAEITLPHRNYPLPTICWPTNSYTGRDMQFPGSTPSHSSSNSPNASRTFDQNQHRPMPRPRTLFIDRKLPQLVKEDPTAYSFFIEGIALLAYDVAWLCRSQGLPVDFHLWEEVCPYGRNLWRLFVEESKAPPMKRHASAQERAKSTPLRPPALRSLTTTPAKSKQEFVEPALNTAVLGYYSHGTAQGSLAAVDGQEHMRKGKVIAPLRIRDMLKSVLMADIQGAEWEVVDQHEWDDEGVEEEPVLVGAKRRDSTGMKHDDDRSVYSTDTAITARTDRAGTRPAGNVPKAKGSSGWTKLRTRSSDDPAK